MKNFDWTKFVNEKILVHCNTEEKAKDFIRKCYNKNIKWKDDKCSFKVTGWDRYKENIFYVKPNLNDCNGICICVSGFEDYKIIEWEIEDNTINYNLNRYNIHGINSELYLELNESQIKLLDLLIDEGIIDKNDITELDNIEFKTI